MIRSSPTFHLMVEGPLMIVLDPLFHCEIQNRDFITIFFLLHLLAMVYKECSFTNYLIILKYSLYRNVRINARLFTLITFKSHVQLNPIQCYL